MSVTLEERVTVLEREIQEMKLQKTPQKPNTVSWLDTIFGSFADNPAYEEAMRLGKEYRESQKIEIELTESDTNSPDDLPA
jgi:hypothetical protein